jgi:CubicO group peptidase (beta-lactamase class C family)
MICLLRHGLPLLLASQMGAALAAPDENLLGKEAGYPVGTVNTFGQDRFKVGSLTAMDQVFTFNPIRKGNGRFEFRRVAEEPAITYQFKGSTYSIDDYLARQRVTGLLVIKNGEILIERYQYGRKDSDRFYSMSMGKSITSLAVGLALSEGKIRSLDDKAAIYVPELVGSAYGETSIRDLLRMSSGVRFSEDYSGKDDNAAMLWMSLTHGLLEFLKRYSERTAAPGERFYYASSETTVLGFVVRGATGTSLAEYISEKLWRPLGAESDALYSTDVKGAERASAGFNATLRDYGRLGWLLANDGALNGVQILPKEYVLEATSWKNHPPQFHPGRAQRFFGYGYQFWIEPGERRRFWLLGLFGQAIAVDPEHKLVMVHTAVAKDAKATDIWPEKFALWKAIVSRYGKW